MRPRNHTEEDLRAMQARVRKAGPVGAGADSHGAGLGRKVSPVTSSPYKSKWELNYAKVLDLELKAGAIKGWLYEPFSFKLATGKRYRVDFVTWGSSGIECIEVKGRWVKNRRDGITHLHWAAQRFPFLTWRLVWRTQAGGWDGKYITP